jgi:hypothetical protein
MIHFIRIPKTASRAIKETELFECKRHVSVQYLQKKYRDTWQDDTSFCVVRNPYDRLVSCYFCGQKFYKNRQYPFFSEFERYDSFREFCLDKKNPFLYGKVHRARRRKKNKKIIHPHFRTQCYWILNNKKEIGVDYVLRYENLEEDWQDFLVDQNMNVVPLKVVNKSRHKPYYKYYDRELANIVYKAYEPDFLRLNYSFESYKG